jgi:high-affinity Fe2+/Pb2+ permease
MGLDLGVNGKFFGFLLFIVLMFVITYRSGQILMNPFLLVAGWQLYELNIVTEGHKRCVKALSEEPVRSGDRLDSCLVHGIYVLHRREK